MKYLLLLTTLLFSANILAANEKGNGGDFIRQQFINISETVLSSIKEDPSFFAIDKKELQRALDIQYIQVTNENLFDNQGSAVDSKVENGKIYLYKDTWEKLFLYKSTDIHKLVFHELLRFSKVNDDNYIISKKLNILHSKNNGNLQSRYLAQGGDPSLLYFVADNLDFIEVARDQSKMDSISELKKYKLIHVNLIFSKYPTACIVKGTVTFRKDSNEQSTIGLPIDNIMDYDTCDFITSQL